MIAPILTFISMTLILTSCVAATSKIDMFIMDYPHGEYRIHVRRTGEAYLYYGASASSKVIKKNTFSVDDLYRTFKKHLHPNLPREKWPDPKSQSGMVTVRYKDGKQVDYLIFDVPVLTDKIFKKAQQNVEANF